MSIVESVTIREVLTGRCAPLPGSAALSGIAKWPAGGATIVGPSGMEGDEQADRRHHGGSEKAVHHYAFDHYPVWRDELPSVARAVLSRPGAFGENISTDGLTEADMCVGDRWRAGSALLEVSQARQPCWKLNFRFQVPDMARRVQHSARTGWYFRVIESGEVAAGDSFTLLSRPHPDWPLARLLHALYVDRLDDEALRSIAGLEELSTSWRALAAKRLERGIVEDWSPRLEGTLTDVTTIS